MMIDMAPAIEAFRSLGAALVGVETALRPVALEATRRRAIEAAGVTEADIRFVEVGRVTLWNHRTIEVPL